MRGSEPPADRGGPSGQPLGAANIAPCRTAREEYDLSQGSRHLTALLCAAPDFLT